MHDLIRLLGGIAPPLALFVAAACGGDVQETSSAPTSMVTTTIVALTTMQTSPPTTIMRPPPPEGVEYFQVEVIHTMDPVVYPHTPPVGGPHCCSGQWVRCAFYDMPVKNELAVHSMEHGGTTWVTYRPDLPADQIQVLQRLASSRKYLLVSRWDVDLPAPVVASSWGRQLKLQSADDPRLVQFADAFLGLSPEPDAPC